MRRPSVRSTRGSGWSQRVTRQSNALDLEPGVFALDDAREIARSLQRSAERRLCLEQAKDELRVLYVRAPRAARGEGSR